MMAILAAIGTFILCGVLLALLQGVVFGWVGLGGLLRVAPWRTIFSTIRTIASAYVAFLTYQAF